MSEPRRYTPLFALTLVALAVVGGVGLWWVGRQPRVGVEDTVRAFLDAARAQRFEAAKEYCTPDLAPQAIRAWMSGGFEYRLEEVESATPSSAEIEAEITKSGKPFILRFQLYNGDNRWRINLMMVSR